MSEIFGDQARPVRWGPGRFGWSERLHDGGVEVRVAGELDLATSAELRERLMAVVESSPGAMVVLDLRDVRYIDAHSVGLIVDAWSAARCNGRRLEVAGLREIPAQVFVLLGVEWLLARRMCEDAGGRDTRGRYGRSSGAAARRRSAGGANGAG